MLSNSKEFNFLRFNEESHSLSEKLLEMMIEMERLRNENQFLQDLNGENLIKLGKFEVKEKKKIMIKLKILRTFTLIN